MFAILNEVKKVVNFKSIIIVIFICIISNSFCSKIYKQIYGIEHMDSSVGISSMMIDKYGEYLDEEELEEFNNIFENRIKETEEYIQKNENNKNITIFNEKEGKGSIYFQINGNDRTYNEEVEEKINNLNEKYEREIDELININYCRLTYKNQKETLELYWQLDNNYKRVKENGEWKSIFPEQIFNYYNFNMKSLAYVFVITIIILSSTLILNDKKEKVDEMQYVSKIGGNIYNIKVKANIIASSILFIVETLVMFILFFKENTIGFLNININSFLNSIFSVDITYLQYIIFSLFIIYVIGISISLITVFFSSEANNYIEIIVMQVIFVFIMIGIICPLILNNFTYIKGIVTLIMLFFIGILVNRKGYKYLLYRLGEE